MPRTFGTLNMVCTVCLDADNASRADSLEKKWLVPLAYLHLGLYLAGLFHIISISDYNYYEPTRLTPVFECMFFCSICMMPTLLLYVMVWNIMTLIKRNMAGGEKKRVSEIERERASRAVAEQPTFRRWITTQFLPQRA